MANERYLANFHVRGRGQEEAAAAVRFGRFTPAWVSPGSGGWTSVFPAPAESYDPEVLNRIGLVLSRSLSAPVLGFWLYASVTLRYTVFEHGEIRAEYDSYPELAERRVARYREATDGNPVLLSRLCPRPAAPAEIKTILERKPYVDALMEVIIEEKLENDIELRKALPKDYIDQRVMEKRGYAAEEERLADLAVVLEIPHALFSFRGLEDYFSEGGKGLIPGEEEFVRVEGFGARGE